MMTLSTDNKKYFGIRDIARIAGVSTFLEKS